MNPNWIRWIHASLITYFTEYFKDEERGRGLLFRIEGQDVAKREEQDWVEFRWDGPTSREVSKRYWYLDIEINVLVSSIVSRDDTYRHKKNVGLVEASFINSIPVLRYGDVQEVDDETLLGCLELRSDNREAIVTSYFGKIESDVVLEQSTVEAHYRLTLTL